MGLLSIIQGLIAFIFNSGILFINLFFALVAGVIAWMKGRSFWLWGIATYFFPLLIFIILFMPRKYPKFQNHMHDKEAFNGKNPVIASIMALAAIVAKSDGNVSKEEITIIKRFISNNFRITGNELDSYSEAFDYGKNHPDEYKSFVRVIHHYYRRREVHVAIAYLLVSVAMQNGGMSENEDLNVRNILLELGLSDYEYRSIKNIFVQGQSFQGNKESFSKTTSSSYLSKKYAEVLDVNQNASMAEIKKAYRKKVKEYHPDRMASKGMPQDYINFTNKKITEINEAYEYFKKLRAV